MNQFPDKPSVNRVSTDVKSSGDFSYRFHNTLHLDVYAQPTSGIANTFQLLSEC